MPLHKKIEEVMHPLRYQHFKAHTNAQKGLVYIWQLASPLNFDYVEDAANTDCKYKIRERDPCQDNRLWELFRYIRTQDMKYSPTPNMTYTTGNFTTQTEKEALKGFADYPNLRDEGAVLRAKDSVAWVVPNNYDNVEGHLTLFPCEHEEDTVYLEYPRYLWPQGTRYPPHYDAKRNNYILNKVPLENLQQEIAKVRRIFDEKGPDVLRNLELEALKPKNLSEGRYFMHQWSGEAMKPYSFKEEFRNHIEWKSAPRPSEYDQLGPLTHASVCYTTACNLEDKMRQKILVCAYLDGDRFKVVLPVQKL